MGRRVAITLIGVLLGAIGVAPSGASATPTLEWEACPPEDDPAPGQECASLSVPLDYAAPTGDQIEIAVSRIPATTPEQRRGVLLLNPGGPGSRGLTGLPAKVARLAPPELLERYDLIGFDPRGIGRSTGVTCDLAPEQMDLARFLPWPAPDGSIDENVAYSRGIAESCAAADDVDYLPHITTANTARDMDRIRAALGEQKISYLGYSYGSYLGAVYASLFEDRADLVALDSVVHPGRIWREAWRSWGYATEIRFPDFTRWAAERDEIYGLGNTSREVRELYLELASRLDREPLDLGNVILTGNLFRTVMRQDIYDDLLFGDLAGLMQFLDTNGQVAGRAQDEPFAALAEPPADNGFASVWAVVCDDADWPVSVEQHRQDVARDSRLFPLAGGMAANIWPCAFWPNEPVEHPVAIDVESPTKVLLIQGLRDPATPYDGAVAMRLRMGSRSRLVTVDNGGHIAAFDDDRQQCADRAVTDFFVGGSLPRRDSFCKREPVEVTPALRERAREDVSPSPLGL
jgi:pimeloyl-ACP methyl ester carboxylesterase